MRRWEDLIANVLGVIVALLGLCVVAVTVAYLIYLCNGGKP